MQRFRSGSFLHRVVLLGVVTLLVNLSYSPCLPAQMQEPEIKLIKLVALELSTNKDRILTWRGSALVGDRSVVNPARVGQDPPFERLQKQSVQFVYDRAQNATRFTGTTVEDWVIDEHGRRTQVPEAEVLKGMRKADGFYRLVPIQRSNGKLRHYFLHIAPVEQTPRDLLRSDSHFDPMWYFTDRGRDWAARLTFLSHSGGGQWTVHRDGERITLEGSTNQVLNCYTFDLSLGGNLTLAELSDPDTSERLVCEYGPNNEIWLPTRVFYEHKKRRGTADLYTRTIEWKESIVNKPVDVEEFSNESVGVRPGDQVNDSRYGVWYDYVKPALPLQSPAVLPHDQRSYLLPSVAGGMVVGVLVIFVAICWRRLRARGKQ